MSSSGNSKATGSHEAGYRTIEELADAIKAKSLYREDLSFFAGPEEARRAFLTAPYPLQLACGLEGFATIPSETIEELLESFFKLVRPDIGLQNYGNPEYRDRRIKALREAVFYEELVLASLGALLPEQPGHSNTADSEAPDEISQSDVPDVAIRIVAIQAELLRLMERAKTSGNCAEEKDESGKKRTGRKKKPGSEPSVDEAKGDPSLASPEARDKHEVPSASKRQSMPDLMRELPGSLKLKALTSLLPMWQRLQPFQRMLDLELHSQIAWGYSDGARRIHEDRMAGAIHSFEHSLVRSGSNSFWADAIIERSTSELLVSRIRTASNGGKVHFDENSIGSYQRIGKQAFLREIAKAGRLCATSFPMLAFGSREKIETAKKWAPESGKSAAQLLEEARQQAAARNGQAEAGKVASRSEHHISEETGSDGSRPEGFRPEGSGTDTTRANIGEAKSVLTEVARISVDELLARLDQSDPAGTKATEQKLQELVDREIEKTDRIGQSQQGTAGAEPDPGSGSGGGSALDERQSSTDTSDAEPIDMLIVAEDDRVPDASRPEQVHVRMASVIRQEDSGTRYLSLQKGVLGFIPGNRKDVADPELYHTDLLVPADAIPEDSTDPIGEIARLAVQPAAQGPNAEQSGPHGASVEVVGAGDEVFPAVTVRVWRSVPMRIGEVRENRVILLGNERLIQQRMHNHERKEDPDTRIREAIGGKPLPLLPVPDLVLVRSELLLRYPHLESAIDAFLNGLAGKPFLRIEPTLLVGPPGSAKTSLAEDIFSLLGIPNTTFDAGGNNDGMVFGISRKWSNAAPGLHLDMLIEHRIANPAIVIDEIEKVGNGYRNTNPLNLMLGPFEPRRAGNWYDPFLETPLVMSHFSWIATANSVDPLSMPLRNRMRVIPCPLPTAEHLEPIAQQLLTAEYEKRNTPEVWREKLTREELAAIGEYWPPGNSPHAGGSNNPTSSARRSGTGENDRDAARRKGKPEPCGSIRDLRRYVEGVLNAREQAMARC
ncbi:MAG: AAA family ATPase [Nitratireductor sp.]|nr:AAA family ATPase [Nitratireductor sp.]